MGRSGGDGVQRKQRGGMVWGCGKLLGRIGKL